MVKLCGESQENNTSLLPQSETEFFKKQILQIKSKYLWRVIFHNQCLFLTFLFTYKNFCCHDPLKVHKCRYENALYVRVSTKITT